MHILLLILKIIGILLLILLGLLLLFVLAVLFAPVRYRADGTLLEKKKADISANWLLFVLRVACSIKNGEVTACVRLFGIPVFTYPKRKKQKEKQGQREVCIQHPAFVGYNNNTIAEKLQGFFRKKSTKWAGCCTFGTTHKS